MPQNTRVYYPIHAIGFAPLGTSPSVASSFRAVKGVQAVGLNTTFNLEQVYQLGQLSLYENIENLPEIELTVSKVADGFSLIQHLATPTAISNTLAGRFNDNQSMGLMAFYPTSNDAASGTPLSYVLMSGLYVSSVSWTFPVEGNITESVTLSCRDKTWFSAPTSGTPWASGSFRTTSFTGNDSPVLASGGVQRRENVRMGSGVNSSRWPTDIGGIDAISGFNVTGSNGQYGTHIQSTNISTSFGRSDLLELGRSGPYSRYANFPVEVTCSIEITASEAGDNKNVDSSTTNLTDQYIKIVTDNGIIVDLGSKNKLASINFAGGDTGGGNKTVTYNYSNFNEYSCRMAATDPAGL